MPIRTQYKTFAQPTQQPQQGQITPQFRQPMDEAKGNPFTEVRQALPIHQELRQQRIQQPLRALDTNFRGKIDKEALPQYLLWASAQISRLKRQSLLLKYGQHGPNAHPGYKKQILVNNLLTRLNKYYFNEQFIPLIARYPQLLQDIQISKIIKQDFQEVNRVLSNNNQLNLNLMRFLEESIKLLNQSELPQNVEKIKDEIIAKLAIYNEKELSAKLSKVTERYAMYELELLERFSKELNIGITGNYIPERLGWFVHILKTQLKSNRLADYVIKQSHNIPLNDAQQKVVLILQGLRQDGANFLMAIEPYNSPRLIANIPDMKSRQKISSIAQKSNAFRLLTAIATEIRNERQGAKGGRWPFFTAFANRDSLKDWTNRFMNGYAITQKDLALLPRDAYRLIGMQIWDREIAQLFLTLWSNKQIKDISTWNNTLWQFLSTRVMVIANELRNFLQRRIAEIPLERRRALEEIVKEVEKRKGELKGIETRIRGSIIKGLSQRKNDLEKKIEEKRKKWESEVKDSSDEAIQNINAIKELLDNNLAVAEKMLMLYLTEYYELKQKNVPEPENRIKLLNLGDFLVKYVWNITDIYVKWYQESALMVK